jgi:glycosyltransferase involved in cell wall biosynthesis
MQEIKKRRIVLASVLKPVDDTRMFEKFGLTLAKDYEVHIIGKASTKRNDGANPIIQHSLGEFPRISLKRLLTPWKVFLLSLKVKPDIIIITTHELLLPAVLLKLVRKTKVIYDVQENYYRNILHTNAFNFLIRPFLAAYVRAKEKLASSIIDYYFLAEAAYANEMTFPRGKSTVVENKYKDIGLKSNSGITKSGTTLLFSGTLSTSTGVFKAIELADVLYKVDSTIQLKIVGSCALQEELEQLRKQIENKAYIQLIGGDKLVPHQLILAHIKASDFGIISYPENPATINSVPTKLYEYLANKLPILLVNHPRWVSICNKFSAAVVFDYKHVNGGDLLLGMRETAFYPVNPTDVWWSDEEPKILSVLNSLSNNS